MNHIESLNKIESSAKIDERVTLGKNNYIGHNVVIQGSVIIGDNNYIASGTLIGGEPRMIMKPEKWETGKREENYRISIGNNNLIFENTNIHAPSIQSTIIENDVSIGSFCNIGHDSIIKDRAILSTNVLLGGCTIVGSMANLGLGVRIHPRSVIGQYSMCGMGAVVKGYVFPSTLVTGVPAKYKKINTIGLDRFEVSEKYRNEIIGFFEEKKIPTLTEVKEILDIFFNDCEKYKKLGLNLNIIK